MARKNLDNTIKEGFAMFWTQYEYLAFKNTTNTPLWVVLADASLESISKEF